jgi:hypothetical protein
VAAILVLPAAAPGTIHMVLANLDDATVGIEAEAGMEICHRPAAE